MTKPLVSIIIPTYNRAHLIGETLDSVLAQTYTNWECIVVDDGSTDGTEVIMSEYMNLDFRFQYYHRPKDRLSGGNEARNYGFEISKGEYVNWFDDDDIMLSCFLKTKIEAIEPEKDLIICTGSFWNPISNTQRIKNLRMTTNLYQDFLCWRLKILTPSVLFRRTFLMDKELFSNRILRGQESEFFLRVFYKLPRDSFKIINKSLFLYRQHENNKTTKDSQYVPEFKEGRYFIYYENYMRLQGTGEKKSIDFCYHQILNLFYSSVNYKHIQLSRKIMKEFFPSLKQQNYLKGMEILFFGNLFILFNRSSYKLIGRWKEFDFLKV